jgi:hypothetical protein
MRNDGMRAGIGSRIARLVPQIDAGKPRIYTVRFNIERSDHHLTGGTVRTVCQLFSSLRAISRHCLVAAGSPFVTASIAA